MIYDIEPKEFNPRFEVVSCFIENEGKILLLHRQNHKPEGNKWGVPAGKIDGNEDTKEALLREVFEETGIKLKKPEYHHKVYVKYPNIDFIYHVYSESLSEKPKVTLREEEHKDYVWITPKEALNINLLLDEDLSIKKFYQI